MTVNKERVQLLVDALRSGEYTQGRAFLEADGENCCLGVACRVAQKNGLSLTTGTRIGTTGVTLFGLTEEGGFLPGEVQKWFGFDSEDPIVQNDYTTATNLNDNLRMNFLEIADAFERHYINGK